MLRWQKMAAAVQTQTLPANRSTPSLIGQTEDCRSRAPWTSLHSVVQISRSHSQLPAFLSFSIIFVTRVLWTGVGGSDQPVECRRICRRGSVQQKVWLTCLCFPPRVRLWLRRHHFGKCCTSISSLYAVNLTRLVHFPPACEFH